uniref:Uncharacterized protein n=1 Tax=Arundo donax TaxID=35708 RepID=A0A0A9H4P3_ARUDO
MMFISLITCWRVEAAALIN